MGHYSDTPGSVRVDIFKPSGKWYETIAVDMNLHYNDPLVTDAVRAAVLHKLDDGERYRLGGMTYVVIDPYHKNSYPVMGTIPEKKP